MQAHVLFIEEDIRLAQPLANYFKSFGYKTTILQSSTDIIDMILAQSPDLVLLDIILPGKDGLSICRELRQKKCEIPLIIFTSLNSDTNQILCFEMGATDYLPKTTSPSVLLARIKAHLRRMGRKVDAIETNSKAILMDFGVLQIDPINRSVLYRNQIVNFSTREFDILCELASRAGEVSTRESLLQALRGISYDGFDRSIDAAISRIRKKLGDDPNYPRKIKTVRYKGYLFANDVWKNG